MGWLRYYAHCYKPNGTVDRKAECDKLFTEVTEKINTSTDDGGKTRYIYEVLKSSMVGSTYYAAVRLTIDMEKADGTHDIRKNTFAVVCLTAGNSRYDGCDFGVKEMDESCGPRERKCPNSILALLDEPCNDWARKWREDCRAYNEAKKCKRVTRKAA